MPYGDLSIRSNAAATYATSNKKPSVIRDFLICVRSAGIKFHRERCILSYNEVKGKISRYISLLSVKKKPPPVTVIDHILQDCVPLIDLDCAIILQKCRHMLISIEVYIYYLTPTDLTK